MVDHCRSTPDGPGQDAALIEPREILGTEADGYEVTIVFETEGVEDQLLHGYGLMTEDDQFLEVVVGAPQATFGEFEPDFQAIIDSISVD
ncbi:hypothetical protein ACPYO6_12305 [Georgenia sp. Z1344]|uniref:hypothetical protein n=1 Tax=Georgenia sp. Z1344 TaxID=3416706 RepID=UPI003CF5F052